MIENFEKKKFNLLSYLSNWDMADTKLIVYKELKVALER